MATRKKDLIQDSTNGYYLDDKVGIGITPSTTLHSNSGAEVTGASFKTTGTGSYVAFQDATSSNWYANKIGAVGNELVFVANASERMRILSTGGITFNGDTSTANALDDYEEGTFTPTAYGATTAGTTTYNSQIGFYTKIGREVHFRVFLNVTSMNGTGDLRFGGLPFTSLSTSTHYQSLSVGYISGLTFSGAMVGLYMSANTDYINIGNISSNISLTQVPVDTSPYQIMFSGSYAV